MYEKCRRMGFKVNKEDVRCLLSIFNPENVALRQRHRLQRRRYTSKGPNYIWHMDSYDKLRPFGICINGCIDGYSRKIIWLNAYFTSSDPSVVASYYTESIKELGGCPTIVRADMGTENGIVCEFQRYLRQDDTDSFQGDKSFLYGKSVCNQRIECWWGMFRKECAEYWIRRFKELRDNGDFDGTFLDKNLILFCFLHILQSACVVQFKLPQNKMKCLFQTELDSTTDVWNNHLIRPSRVGTSPHGRPNVLYTVPELCNTRNYLCIKSEDEIDICNDLVEHRTTVPCDVDVYNWCINFMSENNLYLTLEPNDAFNLYLTLRRSIHQIID
ncbi:uncharacterized protein LOC128559679 [Mercenaria mercenaria]|uniref:uncharacterized protein LOC128559679 n=1 Tax=Mercenaria mercenaria TaxID=6596 RepID=UPI00234E964D|nr:uncharacterized protein LOC128559679 [Mercenaria mercenaria]